MCGENTWQRGFRSKIVLEILMKKKIVKKQPKVIKKSTQKKKSSSFEKITRVPGVDKGKTIIMPNFEEPLTEFTK